MKNLKNRYSFYTLKKSRTFMDLMDGKISEQDIQKNGDSTISSNAITLDTDVNIFIYNNIYEEYSLNTGSCQLYRDLGTDKIELLYKKSNNESNKYKITAYDLNGAYAAIQTDDGIQKLAYINKNAFSSKSIINDKYANIPLIDKYKLTTIKSYQKYIADFNKLNIQYQTASNYIPALNILSSILQTTYKFIANGKLNEEMQDELLQNYIALTNFQNSCYSSIELISGLISNPYDIDLRDFCDKLENKIDNIEHLVNLYLDKDLEK